MSYRWTSMWRGVSRLRQRAAVWSGANDGVSVDVAHIQDRQGRCRALIASLSVVVGALGSWATLGPSNHVECQAPEGTAHSEDHGEHPTQSFMEWLKQHGSDAEAVEVKPSNKQGAGLGLFATEAAARRLPGAAARWARWATLRGPGDVEVARFPMPLVLTGQSVVDLPGRVGGMYQDLLELGLVDERMLVVLHLLVERLRGRESQLWPWLDLMPSSFSTPLHFSAQEMEELKGTTLHKAATVKLRQLTSLWPRLEPAARDLLLEASSAPSSSLSAPSAGHGGRGAAAGGGGTAGEAVRMPTLQDFLWAYSLFWSRAATLPIHPKQYAAQAAAAQAAAPAATSPGSSGAAQGKEQQEQQPVVPPAAAVAVERDAALLEGPLDGIIPGVDFCNHQPGAACKWTLHCDGAEAKRASRPPKQVCLVCAADRCPKPGQEITIDYGDKSNEELLFLHGFALELNPYDMLMVSCPLAPPDQWDEEMRLRWELLQVRGLVPQFFLPSSLSGTPRGAAAAAAAPATLAVPEDAIRTLEVFVMEPQHVVAELQAASAQAPASGDAADAAAGPGVEMGKVEAGGLRMAVLTTLMRLLEAKVLELEGEGGTGTLEQDVDLLLGQGDELSPTRRSCVVYRSAQKRIARDWLLTVRGQVARQMEELKQLMSAEAKP